jgi:Lysozyme like domain
MDKNMTETRFQAIEVPAQLLAGVQAHFPEGEWGNALDVAYLESHWNNYAVNDSIIEFVVRGQRPAPVNGIPSSPELSVGCFQVNVLVHRYAEWPTLFDPFINAWAAHQIWQSAGGWSPWYHSSRALGLA